MSAAVMTARQIRYVNKMFWRNPVSAFFTFAFPLMFLVIFTTLLGHGTVPIGSRLVDQSTYYVASMAAFAVVTACFNNIAIAVTFQRDSGVLKRTNGTPLPASAFLGARIVHAIFVAVLLVIITVAFGRAVLLRRHPDRAHAAAVRRSCCWSAPARFCALGLAITTVIPNADASAAIVNAAILPLLFLSGIFIPFGNEHAVVDLVDRQDLPRPALRRTACRPAFLGTTFQWTDTLIVAAWGLGGLL